MNTVKIKWHDLDEDSPANLENFTGVYVLVGENVEDEDSDEVDLLDISVAFKEDITEKLDNPFESYGFLDGYFDENPEMDIFFMMGEIVDTNGQPVSEKLLKDIQCLLISANEPIYNEFCEDPGEEIGEPLRVENEGDFPPLEEVSEIH